jgi:predicted MPP superfamily phosphohydrolase
MRLAWATDIHLNFLDEIARHEFLESIRAQDDALVITGDIGESDDVVGYLREIDHIVERPTFFVLGNHDFYRGSIAGTREAVAQAAAASSHLTYLTASRVVELTSRTALVGHDGWGDARLGDFDGSNVLLNDYAVIAELRHWREDGLDKPRLAEVLYALGDEAGRHFEETLSEAAASYPRVIAATHVPPFREAAWYAGRLSDHHWLPHFSCHAAGQAMQRVMERHPQCQLLVLCGHTHGSGEARIRENLRVLTGAATYGQPKVQQVLEVE